MEKYYESRREKGCYFFSLGEIQYWRTVFWVVMVASRRTLNYLIRLTNPTPGDFFMADKKPLTKTQIIAELAETTALSKKDVTTVVDALSELIKKSLGKKGAGTFTLPGVLKVYKQHVKAKPAQKNVPNPLKPGTFSDRPAKPAHDRVKIKALKSLKEVV
jgi:nucleoid DNA-binding protein